MGEIKQTKLAPQACDHREHLVLLITIKNNSIKYTSVDEIVSVYRNLVKDMDNGMEWSSNPAIELDSLSRLHLHTIGYTYRAPYYKKYQRPGWTIHFQPIPAKEKSRVLNYLRKEDQSISAVQNRDNQSYYSYIDTLN